MALGTATAAARGRKNRRKRLLDVATRTVVYIKVVVWNPGGKQVCLFPVRVLVPS